MAHGSTTTFNYQAGLGNAASFQVSGIPWVSGGIDAESGADSTQEITFPSVTQWVVISNAESTADCRVGFSRLGVTGGSGNYYFNLDAGQVSPRLEVKVTKLFVSGGNAVSVMAGLAGISSLKINNENISPSGSNWSGSLAAQVG